MYPHPYKRPRYGPPGVNFGGWGPYQNFSGPNFNYPRPQRLPYFPPTFTSFDDRPPPRRNETQTSQSVPEVSSTTNNIQQADEPACSSDSPVITTQTTSSQLNTVKEEGLTMRIPKQFYKFLSHKEGTNFRNLMRECLNVVVNFVKPKAGDLVTCKLEGQNENLERAKTAILTFCEKGQSTKKDLRQAISFDTIFTDINSVGKNLDILNNPNVAWDYKAVNLHKHICQLVAKIKDVSSDEEYKKSENDLMIAYQKLNTILIGKLRNGDDNRHMEILERSTDIAEVEKSFQYVFNSNRRIFSNYEELLDQLMIKFRTTSERANKECELEQLKRKVVSICNFFHWHGDRKRMQDLYARVVISNYRDDDVDIFRNQFDKIHVRYLMYQTQAKERNKKRKGKFKGITPYNLNN